MADFSVLGYISRIRRRGDVLCVYIDEYVRSFRRSSGVIEKEKYLTWCCLFKLQFSNFLSRLGVGALVVVKGEILPYGRSVDEKVEGYTILGQVINVGSYPKRLRVEEKMVNDSSRVLGSNNSDDAVHDLGNFTNPDIDSFNEPDF